jgi:hypothetical protein
MRRTIGEGHYGNGCGGDLAQSKQKILSEVPPLSGERSSKPPRQKEGGPMSYEILGSKGQYWTCQQRAWRDYLKLAPVFGWAPEGAFFKDDEEGFGPTPAEAILVTIGSR